MQPQEAAKKITCASANCVWAVPLAAIDMLDSWIFHKPVATCAPNTSKITSKDTICVQKRCTWHPNHQEPSLSGCKRSFHQCGCGTLISQSLRKRYTTCLFTLDFALRFTHPNAKKTPNFLPRSSRSMHLTTCRLYQATPNRVQPTSSKTRLPPMRVEVLESQL